VKPQKKALRDEIATKDKEIKAQQILVAEENGRYAKFLLDGAFTPEQRAALSGDKAAMLDTMEGQSGKVYLEWCGLGIRCSGADHVARFTGVIVDEQKQYECVFWHDQVFRAGTRQLSVQSPREFSVVTHEGQAAIALFIKCRILLGNELDAYMREQRAMATAIFRGIPIDGYMAARPVPPAIEPVNEAAAIA
jgi:hypothetical protein